MASCSLSQAVQWEYDSELSLKKTKCAANIVKKMGEKCMKALCMLQKPRAGGAVVTWGTVVSVDANGVISTKK